jgi:hypothetical protein
MDDLGLGAMLERSTEDPPASFVDGILANTEKRTDTAPLVASHLEFNPIESRLGKRRRHLAFATIAAALVLVVVAGVAISRVDSKRSLDVAGADHGLEVVVDGKSVSAARIDDMKSQTLTIAPVERRELYKASTYDLQVDTAASLLFEEFLHELGKREGAPVTEADIDAGISDSSEIVYRGKTIDKEDALGDEEFRKQFAIGLQTMRGFRVLVERFGSRIDSEEIEAQWRNWFKEQLGEHQVVVRLDGHTISHTTLSESPMVITPSP